MTGGGGEAGPEPVLNSRVVYGAEQPVSDRKAGVRCTVYPTSVPRGCQGRKVAVFVRRSTP